MITVISDEILRFAQDTPLAGKNHGPALRADFFAFPDSDYLSPFDMVKLSTYISSFF